jgi:hypothetical protein
MPVKFAIYDPPEEGLPYLVVTFEGDGPKIAVAKTQFEARTLVAERAIRRRRALKGDASTPMSAQQQA